MALIRLGGLVTDISGKIGGQTLGTSASGSYIKNSGTPRKSITLPQQSQMQLMGTSAQSWRELTQSQRDVFNAASPDYPYLNRVGETKYYSGYAIYAQLRNNAILGGSVDVPVPLPKFSFTPLTLTESSVPSDEGFVQFNGGQSGCIYNLFMTRISSVGISNSYKNMFFMGSIAPTVPGVVFLDYSYTYTAKYGPFPGGGKLFWRVDAIHLATGQSYKNLNSGTQIY